VLEISLSKELQNVVSEIAEISGYMWERGWAERNAGNFTIDVTGLLPADMYNSNRFLTVPLPFAQTELAGRSFIVKVTGAAMRNVARNPKKHLLLITIAEDLSGYQVLWGGEGINSKPTSEFISHLKIHQYLRRNNMPLTVFLHTHPPHLIALSQIEKYLKEEIINHLLITMHPEVEIVIPNGVGVAPYRCPGSEELADVTVAALEKHQIILWEKHGCAAVAANIADAFDYIDIMEKAATIFFLCKGSGYTPQGISEGQLAEISDKFNLKQPVKVK
jgi:rhamnulose-1-phosphate aldolase